MLPDAELVKLVAATVTTLIGAGKAADATQKAIRRGVSVLKRWAFAEDRDQLNARRNKLAAVSAKGLAMDAVDLLYPAHTLAKSGFRREVVLIRTVRRPTSIVSALDLVSCTVDIDANSERVSLKEAPEHKCAPTAESIGFAAADILFAGAKVWDQNVYRLLTYHSGSSHLSLEFALDTFGTYRAGIGALPGELVQSIVDAQENLDLLASESGRFLPLRTHFLPEVSRLNDLNGTLCVGGISLLIAMRREQSGRNDYVMPLQVRSTQVSGNRGVLGVIPHAFHQPVINPYEELALSSTCLREIYEELFGGEEVEKNATRLAPDWYLGEHAAMKWLADHRDQWSLRLTGFGFDLMHGGYEAAMLLIIHDPGFYKTFSHLLRPNWEVDSAQALDARPNPLGLDRAKSPIPMVSSLGSEQLGEYLTRRSWAGSGLWCFDRGLSTLASVDSVRVATLR